MLDAFTPLPGHLPHQATRIISQILILAILFLITLFLGFVARRFFFNRLLKFGDYLMSKIPLVNKIYKTSKDIVLSFFNNHKQSFKQVVLLKFPYSEAYSIGLITNDSPKTCNQPLKSDMLSVFIPTTPNPTTGYLVMCRKEDLIFLNMSTEDAIKYTVSCAVIQPEKKQ